MSRVSIYIEGGGESDALRRVAKSAFAQLLSRTPCKGVMPSCHCKGGRQATYDAYVAHLKNGIPRIAILLVDSEEPIQPDDDPWTHLANRAGDNMPKPAGVQEHRCFLMVTCMEAWIAADHSALQRRYGAKFNPKGLPPLANLESTDRKALLKALQKATSDRYGKGMESFKILAEANPETLLQLPSFKRFIDGLTALLKS